MNSLNLSPLTSSRHAETAITLQKRKKRESQSLLIKYLALENLYYNE